ncbi:hypothetical protein UFOVP2_2 [uncultured Caudovirales phage]|uniref:Uncharacterized protein n=1 Tax=uncultured Caudovirales phage TaxID=2100421 RepID=A0A6J5KFX2_9CAUD|nr:hypothetical protein UFOVP2_2 [uncultured Caudovirales phage]
MLMTTNDLALRVKLIADRLFPNRSDASMYLKLYEETAEVIQSNGAPDEVADIFILWMDYALRKGIDIEAEVMSKLRILESRAWELDNNGVYHHVGK